MMMCCPKKVMKRLGKNPTRFGISSTQTTSAIFSRIEITWNARSRKSHTLGNCTKSIKKHTLSWKWGVEWVTLSSPCWENTLSSTTSAVYLIYRHSTYRKRNANSPRIRRTTQCQGLRFGQRWNSLLSKAGSHFDDLCAVSSCAWEALLNN